MHDPRSFELLAFAGLPAQPSMVFAHNAATRLSACRGRANERTEPGRSRGAASTRWQDEEIQVAMVQQRLAVKVDPDAEHDVCRLPSLARECRRWESNPHGLSAARF
jgi:hypothetical protein